MSDGAATSPPLAERRPSPAGLLGRLDRADRAGIAGWAFDPAHPASRVTLALTVDGVLAGNLLADQYRADLAQSGIGDGRHSFEVRMPYGLSALAARTISVARASDKAELEGSPITLPAEPLGPEQALRTIAEAAQDAADAGDRPALLALLARLAARVAALEEPPDRPRTAFLSRWGQPALQREGRPRALFIDDAVPDAARDAGSSAALSHMAALASLGFAVEFVPAWSPDVAPAHVARLGGIGIEVWHAPWIGSVEEVLRAAGPMIAVVYVHRYGVMARYASLIRHWCPQARLVYCLGDLHHLRAARQEAVQADCAPDAPPPPAIAALRIAELNAVRAADAAITHSSHEAALLAQDLPEAAVHLVTWAIPPAPVGQAFGDRKGVAFIGSYGHLPNLDAAYVLLDTVMELVWAQDPTLPCVLAGSDLPADLRAHAARCKGPVQVLGWVEAMETVWSQVRVSVAPLRFGAGLKGKVLDSMAAGIPCVCSPIAAEGMDLPPDLRSLVAEAPADMADAILALHRDAALNEAASNAGVAFIAASFNAERVRAGMASALGLAATVDVDG